jgi:hypothetical protein
MICVCNKKYIYAPICTHMFQDYLQTNKNLSSKIKKLWFLTSGLHDRHLFEESTFEKYSTHVIYSTHQLIKLFKLLTKTNQRITSDLKQGMTQTSFTGKASFYNFFHDLGSVLKHYISV